MTYAQIAAELKTLAEEAGAASFWHGKQTAADINYNAAFPQAHLFLMPSTLRGGYVVTRVNMCFYDKDTHESSNEEVLAIQDAMDVLSQQFVADLIESGIGEVGDVERTPTLRTGAGIGTGFFISFALTTLGQC